MNESINVLTAQRVRLDSLKVGLSKFPKSRGQALAYTALERGRMYIGEICRELGKAYPYEATKTATTAEGIQDAVDVATKETPKFLVRELEIENLNDMREMLDREVKVLIDVLFNPNHAININGTVKQFNFNCASQEAYMGLKEARMWLGIRLGEIRDNSKK